MRIRTVQMIALATLMGACSDATPTGEVTLQLATKTRVMMSSQPQLAAATSGQVTISLGSDEIVVDKVEIVLRKIRLDGTATASCPEDGEGDADCAGVWLGPVLFDLPLGEGAEPTFTALVPTGSYSHVKFQIHKPSNANEDAAFLLEHPDLDNVSIRVIGSYNATPFTYTSDLTEVEDVTLTQPVEVAEDGQLGVTLFVDVAGWFVNAGGSGLVDPAQAGNGQTYESLVEQNIRESFRAFHDQDQDAGQD
jgi:hypothetical protein